MSDTQPDVRPDAPADDVVVSTELKNIIEALIFASDEPMTVRFIRSIMDEVNKDLPPAEHYSVNAEIIRKAVGDLNRGYGKMGSGFRIIEIAGGFIHATQEQFSSWVGKLAKEKARRRLSPTAVETLAIIAYKQPIAKGEVEFIRGVNVDYIINALLEKDLIHITGRANTPGRPLLYGTTQKFLEHFGLNDLTDLPKPREISELINETELEVDRRLLAEQQELEFREDLEKKLEGNEGSKNKPQTKSGPKVKVPENIKEENRRAAKQTAPEGVQQADGAPAAEGALPSESQTTPDAAAAETATVDAPEAAQAVPAELTADAPGMLPEGTVVGAEALPEETVVVPDLRQEEAAEDSVPTAAAEDFEAIVEREEAPSDVLAVMTAASAADRQASGEAVTADDRPSDAPGQDSPEAAPIGVPALPVTAPVKVFADPLAEEASLPEGSENRMQDAEQPHGPEAPGGTSETGWSKWKNKVKTFFQKLFA